MSVLSYIQVDKHGNTILYHLYKCRPYTSRDIRANVGKGRITFDLKRQVYEQTHMNLCCSLMRSVLKSRALGNVLT